MRRDVVACPGELPLERALAQAQERLLGAGLVDRLLRGAGVEVGERADQLAVGRPLR